MSTHRLTGPAPALVRRAGFAVAPLLLACYGVIRLVSGHQAPSPAWTIGHLAFLLGFALFVPVLVVLCRRVPGRARPLAVASAVVGLLGCLATIAQAGIDIAAGLSAPDHAGMSAQYDRIHTALHLPPVVYQLGPALFYVGLLALLVLLVRNGLGSWLAVALTVLSAVLSSVDLDLIPLGGVCLLLALAALGPLDRR